MHLAAWRMGSWLDVFFVFLFLLFLCLFVCLLDFLVFLNRKFSFSNGFFYLYNLHQVPCDKLFCFFFVFVGGGGGRGRWWCGEERNGVNIELRMKEIWLEKRMPINQLIRQ